MRDAWQEECLTPRTLRLIVRHIMRTSTFDLHDRAFRGDLKKTLRALRSQGLSYDEIAFRLRDEGVAVSRSTVHRWCHQLGIKASA